MEATAATARYSWADFVALDEDDLRELVDGALVEIEMPGELHEHIVAALAFFLFGWAREHGGRVHASGYKVRISDRRGVMPDLQYFTAEHASALPPRALEEGRPDLAVEIVSTTSRRYDRVVKLAWYASIGVPEYWIVDPEARTLERLVLGSEGYVIKDALEADASFSPSSFAGLTIPLAELWRAPG